MSKKDSFEKEVERAFRVHRPPRTVTTHSYESDGQRLERTFLGRPWTMIDAASIDEAPADGALPLLTVDAFMYYLPALLVHVDRGSFDPNTRAPDNVYYNLQRVEDHERDSKRTLTKAQRALVERIRGSLKSQLDQR